MRTVVAVAVLSVVVPARADEPKASAPPKDAEWTTTTVPGRFEIQFPGKPTEKPTRTGTQYMLQQTNPMILYLATVAPLPGKLDLTDTKAVQSVFDNAATSTEKSLGGKIVSKKESKVGGKYPVRDMEFEAAGIGRMRTRWVLTPDGFIQVVAVGSKDAIDGANARKFFESFQVKAKE